MSALARTSERDCRTRTTNENCTASESWTRTKYTYDDFNRLLTSNKNSGQSAFSYDYDRYGNRWHQTLTAGSGTTSSLGFDANNHIVSGSGVSYDAAGNVIGDSANPIYVYDAENRIICVGGSLRTASCISSAPTVYYYNAGGDRIRKTTGGVAVDYLYDLGDHVVTEVSSTGGWNRGEVFAGSHHVATYNFGTTYFIHADWLATERVRANLAGSSVESCTNQPFGDNQVCTGTDVSPLHFTGKQRDTETNNDDFGARYFNSNTARWLTPDWSARPEGTPYVTLANPQTLNLYAYVGNRPTSVADPDGHEFIAPRSHFSGDYFNMPDTTPLDLILTETQENAIAAAAQELTTTLNLNGTNVDVTFFGAEFSNGQKGAVIDANPQGACDNCHWAQTVSRTGEDAHGARTDREPDPASSRQPLYPGGVHAGNDAANLSDQPRSTKSGTFAAVSTLGVADKANKTFKVIGSMTWGYKIDKNGNVSGVAPRVATKAEQAASIAVLRRESPTWTIGP